MTRRGVALGSSGVLLVLVGLVFNWSAFYIAGATLLVLVFLAFSNYLRSSEIWIDRTIVPGRVEREALAIAYLHLRNKSQRRFWGADALVTVGKETLATRLPSLRRGEEATKTLRLPTEKRGIFVIGRTAVTRRDVLRLVDVQKPYGEDDALLVSPRILPFKPVVNALTQSLDGKTDDATPHGSMTFHQLREYVPGDDIRKIYWKATARQPSPGTLIVRQDVDHAQPTTTIAVDIRPVGYSPESFELAIDVVASVVESAALGRSPFRLHLTNGRTASGDSRRAVDRALELLTEVQPADTGSIQQLLKSLNHDRGGAVLVVVTGVVDQADVQIMASMRTKFARVFLVSITPEPRPVERLTGITVIQGSTSVELIQAWNIGVKS
jgi:uncharacterized protein (DUF58 family)